MAEIKSDYIRIRVTPDMKAAIAEAAKKEGRSMTNYLEWLVKKELKLT